MKQKRYKKALHSAVNKLDSDDYEVITELYFINASIYQLSKKLGLSRPAVRYRRKRAIKSLKEIISKQMPSY